MASAPLAPGVSVATGERRPLALEGLTKRWRGAETAVLDGVSLTIEPGTAVFVGGANGAGKTTLLRIAAGLILPDAGRIRLGRLDAEADRTEFQRRIGFLSAASAGLYARLTVRDHLRLWSKLALLPRAERERCRGRVAEAMDLGALDSQRVDRLSMGQRQRVRLAGTFLHEPDVVLLDEPGNSLDEDGLELLAAEVERVRSRGGGAIWCAPTSHGHAVAFNRRLTIASGSLVES